MLWALATLPATAAQKLVIKGSNTFGEELGPAVIAEFRKSHPDVEFELESKGSATGFAALLAGECDVASSSRTINEDESRLARSRGMKLNVQVVGYYGVAVVVNASNPVKQLSDVQVRRVFTGEVTNWKEVGGPDLPIQTYIRDPVSGTYFGFQELAMNRQPYVKSAKRLKSHGEIVAAVKADAGGIGYVGMNFATGHGVRGVAVNGVLLSPLAVEDDRYPYARALRLYTDARRESAAVREFIHFILTRRGQNVLEQLGYVKRAERRLWSPTEP
jgi:phosphate transport system substrate-binding protein